MAQVLRRRGRIQVKLNGDERAALIGILDDLVPKLGRGVGGSRRAYDDPELEREYDRWVRPDVDQSRDADISVVRDGLSAGEDTLPLTEAKALCWLRAFNHLRLAAGEQLDIEEDGWEEQLDDEAQRSPELGILLALGYLQEELVAALES
ncbi:MAG: DUF2017 family protein [Candidatus Dormibacteraeota bacterium]|nr:DUF2017 family protein [Candidatus Dormibacteraeota bacterium]